MLLVFITSHEKEINKALQSHWTLGYHSSKTPGGLALKSNESVYWKDHKKGKLVAFQDIGVAKFYKYKIVVPNLPLNSHPRGFR